MSNELKVAIEAAKAGAKVALKYFNKNPKVTVKPDNSPVTLADKEAEQTIKEIISRYYPSPSFLAEETVKTSLDDNFWVINPIDGTKNFLRGLPFWGVEIAFVKDNQIVVGVIYAPCLLTDLLYAEKGRGAYLNDDRITVSKITKLDEAFLIHGTINYFEKRIPQFLKLLNNVYRERGYGDFYGYGLVAQGKADIMMDAHNGPWDIAAVKVIVEEAGGKVTNFQGQDWQLTDSTAVATNGLLHDQVIHILNEQK